MIQLSVCRIGSKGYSHRRDRARIEYLRQKAKKAMDMYRMNLSEGRSWQPGDSVVRQYTVHDEEYFSLKQFITVCVSCQKTSSGGSGKAWSGEQRILLLLAPCADSVTSRSLY